MEEKKNLTEEERKELRKNLKKQFDELSDEELDIVAGGYGNKPQSDLEKCLSFIKSHGHYNKIKEIYKKEGLAAACEYVCKVCGENGVFCPSYSWIVAMVISW